MTLDLVVIGLGYVGLPLAQEATRAGLSVAGLDVDPDTVASLAAGRSHVDDLSAADVDEMLRAGFVPTTDERVLAQADTVVICVPTPLSADSGPDLGPVRAAVAAVARHLRPGTLVVLESTTYPGTTDEVVRGMLEQGGLVAGTDFSLAYSPERIDPGNPTWGLRTYKIRTLGYPFRFVELAQEINARMPAYVAQRAMLLLNQDGKAVSGSTVLLLGVTYKPDIADERESPAQPLLRRLRALGATVLFHDPYVETWRTDTGPLPRVPDLEQALGEADLTVLLQPHAALDLELVARTARRVLDTRCCLTGPAVERL